MTLATDVEVTLESLVLCHIYKGLNDLITIENGKLNGTVRVPISMVHIWLVTYYLDFFLLEVEHLCFFLITIQPHHC